MEYKSYTTKSKLFRKPEHKKERLYCAKEHQNWLNEWNNTIWSDESHFGVFNRKNHTFVGCLKSESNKPFNFFPRVQGGGGYVSV